MEKGSIRVFSAFLRLAITAVTIVYPLLSSFYVGSVAVFQNAFLIFLFFLLLSANVVFQISDRLRFPSLIASFLAAGTLYFMFDKLFILMIVLNIMDCLALLGVSAFWGLFTLLLVPYSGSYRFVFVIFAVLMTFLYYLIYTVVRAQSEFIETTYKKEKQLLNRLREEDLRHKHTLRSTALRFENQRLQEKSELSQNLHDKIGHAINGSIFKLEAAKLLAYKDTAKSTEMIGDVVTALRCSADEIRLLLRDEKPPAELMNIGRLRALLSDFQDNYDIKTELEVEGDTARVPLNVFGILYDNTVEALSNSLKYARCAKVRVTLRVYNKILRYTVTDDGVGAQTITENMGLSGIRERILSVGGTVSVNGANGFEINILVPVPDAGRGDDADE